MKTFIAFLAFAGLALAQQTDTTSFRGMVRLNRAPVSNEVLRIKLPRPVERKLSNGIDLLVLEDHRAPVVYLTITIPSSHLRDPEGKPGVAEATAAVMQLGTTTRTAREIAEALGDIGANVSINVGGGGGFGGRGGNGGGAGDLGTITVSSLTENFDAALEIMSDILLHPSFPADEFEKWKSRQRSAIEQAKSQPNVLASEVLFKTLYPGDPRQFTRPTLDSLSKMTRDDLVAHYKTYFVPSGDLAGIVGDITPNEAVAKLERVLSNWKGGPVEPLKFAMQPPIEGKKVYLVSRPNSVQTVYVLANRAIDRTDPDYIPCMVLNQVLGSGPASRLFRIIREEKGYTYGISSGFTASRVMQTFSSSTSVRTEVSEPALADILKEFHEIREVPVPKDELEGAKRTLMASFAVGLESPQAVLGRWLQQREFGLPANYWDTYTEKVMAVTAADVERVAKKYVPYDNVQVIAVGDGAKIRELLGKFGPVEEVAGETN